MSYGEPPANQQIAQASWTSVDKGPFGTCSDLSSPFCVAACRMYGRSLFARRLKVETSSCMPFGRTQGRVPHRSHVYSISYEHGTSKPHLQLLLRNVSEFYLNQNHLSQKGHLRKQLQQLLQRLYYPLLLVPCRPHTAASGWFLWKQNNMVILCDEMKNSRMTYVQ